jgi:hypothetical protein
VAPLARFVRLRPFSMRASALLFGSISGLRQRTCPDVQEVYGAADSCLSGRGNDLRPHAANCAMLPFKNGMP